LSQIVTAICGSSKQSMMGQIFSLTKKGHT
jgi:hypothetical protein